MKNVKNGLVVIILVIFLMFFSSCDGTLFDDITYVDYPVHMVYLTPNRAIPFHQAPPRRVEPVRRIQHNNIPPRVQRSGPRGAVQSGRGFNRH
jgi:hypothetical protein